jgi:uncharacterized membrane protein YidH (DUF202 family)
MADERPPGAPEPTRDDAVRNGLLVGTHALGLFMAIVGGFIALIAALLGMIQWISEESEGYEISDVLIWFLIGVALAVVGGFLARIREPNAPVDRPDSWSSR